MDYLLIIIIGALLVREYFKDRQHDAQINKLLKAIIAKNSQDYSNMTLSESTQLNMDTPPLGPIDDDLVPISQTDDDLFDKMIGKSLEEEEVENDE